MTDIVDRPSAPTGTPVGDAGARDGAGDGGRHGGPFHRIRYRSDGVPRDWRGPVPVALAVAAILHLVWWLLLSSAGGDAAAQDAWAQFIRAHPDSAYNLSWYGGMHVVSYSVISPYVMALLGVRTTLMIAGTASAGLLARLLEIRLPTRRPVLPAVYGAVAFTGNAVSGRTTFALGVGFGLAALVVVFAWPERWADGNRHQRLLRGAATAVFAALSTMSSPVAGLFLGVVAAALWLRGRRSAAYAVGLPPVFIVGTSALLFPFQGEQPMHVGSVILPFVMGLSMMLLLPRAWKLMRIGGGVYVLAVLLAWLVPSPIGTNVTRLGLLFGGVVLVAVAGGDRSGRSVMARRLGKVAATVLLAMSLITATVWQVATATQDAIHQRPPASWSRTIAPLVRELRARDAELGRVEVVPTRSHRESSALAPFVNLARGWNRQADVSRNAIFYRDKLGADAYHRWLHRWAVHYVVLANTEPDPSASLTESRLVRQGLPYLTKVWSNRDWALYQVSDPKPLVSGSATLLHFDAASLTLLMPSAGTVVVRVPDSPWLSLVDMQGRSLAGPTQEQPDESCLTDLQTQLGVDHRREDWLVLRATEAGTYRIAAPYKLPRGTACLPTPSP